MTGHGKPKDKETKESRKEGKGKFRKNFAASSAGAVGGGTDDMDSSADLVAILANQVVKDEIKKMKGFKSRKKGAKTIVKKKISKYMSEVCLHCRFWSKTNS